MEQVSAPSKSTMTKFSTVIAVSLAIIALVVSGLSIVIARSVLTEQTVLTQSQEAIIFNNDTLTQAIVSLQTKPPAATPPATTSSIRPGLAKPSIRVVREPIEISTESLETELEQVASTLKSKFPKSADALHVVALYKAQTRKYEEARQLWQESLLLSPKQESFYVNIASVAIKQGDFELAVDTLAKAQANGLDSLDIVYHLALAQAKLGRHSEAIASAERLIVKAPKDPSFWSLQAQSLLASEQLEKAETCFRKAMELGDDSPNAIFGLGNTCMRLGKREEATMLLKRYSESKLDTLTGVERYQTLTEKDARQTATTVFTEAAMLYYKNKDLLQTEHLLSRSVALNPRSVPGLLALADYYFKTKMLSEEQVVRERIVELRTSNFDDYLNLAKACAQLGERESAEAALKLSTTLFPLMAEPFSALSQFNLEAGRTERARWYAQQSLDRQASPEGFRFLASLCKRLNDREAEADALKCALQLEDRP